MATFNAKSFEKKLKSLDTTQTGIQTLSLWIIHHRHHGKSITAAWLDYVRKAQHPERKLGLFYLANDVVQNGKHKAKELVTFFGKAFCNAMPLFRDAKIKSQVERVFNIWVERGIYDLELVTKLREQLNMDEVKTVQPESKEIKKEPSAEARKPIPSDFKVSKLLVSIKKTTNLDNDIVRKSKLLDNLAIDASSFNSVKHVKGRSSVGRFHKQFEESKVVLEDYCQLLKRCKKDKQSLVVALAGGQAYYTAAQEEAKVIVNAYKTFGYRLKAMKKKLDGKIKKFEESSGDSLKKKVEPLSEETNIQDMDIDSDSGEEMTESSSKSNVHVTNTTNDQFSDLDTVNGMKSFLDGDAKPKMQLAVTEESQKEHASSNSEDASSPSLSVSTPDGLVIADDGKEEAFGFMTKTQEPSTPVLDGNSKKCATGNADNKPLQSLIDSLFPMLSKSLQTIKEKQAVDPPTPTVSDAMAFALGGNPEEVATLSLTNPQGLSNTQHELISIAAGLTKFDENFLPVASTNDTNDECDKKKHSRHRSHDSPPRKRTRSPRSSRHRRSSRRSSSPRNRRKSHRSSSKDRDDKRRSSPNNKPYYNNRRSPTPEMDGGSQGFSSQPTQFNPSFNTVNNPQAESFNPSVHQSNTDEMNNIPNIQEMPMFVQLPAPPVPQPPIAFDLNGRPLLSASGNPLQLLHQGTNNENILNMPPMPPNILPFQSQNIIQLQAGEKKQNQSADVMTDRLPRIENNTILEPPFAVAPNFDRNQQALEMGPPPGMDLSTMGGLPPEGLPQHHMEQFNDNFRPKFAEPDPLLDQLEQNDFYGARFRGPQPNISNEPIFRPRYRNGGPRFRPRFEHRFPFSGHPAL